MGKVTKSKLVFAREFPCICVTLYFRAGRNVLVLGTSSSSLLLLKEGEESESSLRFSFLFIRVVVCCGFLLFGLC